MVENKFGNFIYYSAWILFILSKSSYDIISGKNSIENQIFSRKNKVKGSTYEFNLFVNSPKLQFIADGAALAIVFLWTIIYFILWIQKTKSMIEVYSNITNLSSQTQTVQVISQINSYYDELNSAGNQWLIYFRALVILIVFQIGFLIQDIMIFLSYFVRKISIKNLSKNFLVLFLLDLANTALAIYLIIKFVFYYNIDRILTRPEEKYYRMLQEIESNTLQPMHWFIYCIWILVIRVFHILIYFDEFALGVLILIIVKMAIKVLKFLVLYFTIILAFSFVGYGMFYDIEEYSTIFKSYNTMFKSSLGGYDYSIYDNSVKSSSTAGRIYLSIYLLVSTILLLNFLIAILNDTYAEYINNESGLQSKETIKIRALYEENDYYQWLAKTNNLLNFYMIILAPFVVILKSKKLNKIILHIEFGIIISLGQLVSIVNLTINTPIFLIIITFIKLRYAFSSKYSKGFLDLIVRILDCGAVLLLSPIVWVILYSSVSAYSLGSGYHDNQLKLVETYKDEYETINRLMDSSIKKDEENDPISDQRKYMLFM